MALPLEPSGVECSYLNGWNQGHLKEEGARFALSVPITAKGGEVGLVAQDFHRFKP
jgi:hypothetical protein